MLIVKTKRIVVTKSLSWICSKSPSLRRQLFFPKPESTAVDVITVLPRANTDAATMMTSSVDERWRRCAYRYRATTLATVHMACMDSQY
jgi:hypothetical protein